MTSSWLASKASQPRRISVPGLLFGGTGQDVDSHGEAGLPADQGGTLAHLGELDPEVVERFEPRKVVVGVSTGRFDGGIGRTREVDLRDRLLGQWLGKAPVLDLDRTRPS